MNINLKIALGFASVYELIKLLLTFLGLQHEVYANYFILTIPFIVLFSIIITLNYKNRLKIKTELLQDVKFCLNTSSLLALFFATFSYIHYKWIDPNYFIIKNEIMSGGKEMPEIVKTVFNIPFRLATVNLMVIMGMGFVVSFILAAINKKVFEKNN